MSYKKFKFEMASRDRIETYPDEVAEILMAIGSIMDKNDPADWAASCFVSDESCVGDFFGREQTIPPTLLGVSVGHLTRIWEVADALRRERTIQ